MLCLLEVDKDHLAGNDLLAWKIPISFLFTIPYNDILCVSLGSIVF